MPLPVWWRSEKMTDNSRKSGNNLPEDQLISRFDSERIRPPSSLDHEVMRRVREVDGLDEKNKARETGRHFIPAFGWIAMAAVLVAAVGSVISIGIYPDSDKDPTVTQAPDQSQGNTFLANLEAAVRWQNLSEGAPPESNPGGSLVFSTHHAEDGSYGTVDPLEGCQSFRTTIRTWLDTNRNQTLDSSEDLPGEISFSLIQASDYAVRKISTTHYEIVGNRDCDAAYGIRILYHACQEYCPEVRVTHESTAQYGKLSVAFQPNTHQGGSR